MHIGPKGMRYAKKRLWMYYGKRCVTFLSLLFICYSLIICDLMFIFSFLKFLYNLYYHFFTFAFHIPENYVPNSSIFFSK